MMNRPFPRLQRIVLIASVAAALAACATPPNSSPSSSSDQQANAKAKRGMDTCVFNSALDDWQALDDNTLVVWAPSKRDAYKVSLSMPLMGLKFAHQLGFADGTRDGRLCSYGRDSITLGNDSMAQRSSISYIEKLNAETMAQLETKYSVKLLPESKRKARPAEPERASAQ